MEYMYFYDFPGKIALLPWRGKIIFKNVLNKLELFINKYFLFLFLEIMNEDDLQNNDNIHVIELQVCDIVIPYVLMTILYNLQTEYIMKV